MNPAEPTEEDTVDLLPSVSNQVNNSFLIHSYIKMQSVFVKSPGVPFCD